MADAPPIPPVFRRLSREFPAVRPDDAPRLRQLKQLHDFVALHHELDSVVVDMHAWPSRGIAIDLGSSALPRCIFRMEIFAVLVFLAECRIVQLFSVIREGSHRDNTNPAALSTSTKLTGAVEAPNSGEVVRIKR